MTNRPADGAPWAGQNVDVRNEGRAVKHELVTLPDASALASQAAEFVAARARAAVTDHGRFTFAVSGGKTPWAMFAELAHEDVPWARVQLFQVDERAAPDGDPDRNLTHLRQSLGAAPAEVVAMAVTESDLDAAALAYSRLLPDRFDLVHLGLGPDGHTASLVPGDPVLEVTDRLVAVTQPYQEHRRMTLTYPALARADELLWLISGADKQDALAKLLEGDTSIPAARVEARHSTILADADAARAASGASVVTSPPIRLLLADVDGTLVTQDKVLTSEAVDAVHRLRAANILFAITSGRPPRGMAMLIEPLDLQTPIAAFNGGLIVDRDMNVIEQRTIPEDLVVPIADLMGSFDLTVWIYRGPDWYVPDPKGPHVDREAWTVKFEPKVMSGLEGLTDDVAKIVGVSDDHEAVARASVAAHERFGDHVTAAASQPYYLDVTHPQANKGEVVKYLAGRYHLSTAEIATIGDMPNDILMFAHSGLSIAMGNADPAVQRAARRVTDTNENEGFAKAVRRFILPAP